MLNVFVNGCNGKMGNVVCSLVEENKNMQVIGGFDKVSYSDSKFPIFTEAKIGKTAPGCCRQMMMRILFRLGLGMIRAL